MTLRNILCASLLVPTIASAQVIIQFGGEAAKYTRINDLTATANDNSWLSQIGANEIVQWNGVNNSDQDTFGNFGNAGTFADQTVSDSAKLTSKLSPLEMSITAIATTQGGSPARVSATSTPNILGVNDSSDTNAQFNAGNNEVLVVSFNQDVTLLQMIGAGMNFNAERWGLDVGNDGTFEWQWNRSDGFTEGTGTIAEATFDTGNRYVATFGSGVAISSGTEFSITALQGDVNLHGLVFSTVPEPSTYAAILGGVALGFILLRRRRR